MGRIPCTDVRIAKFVFFGWEKKYWSPCCQCVPIVLDYKIMSTPRLLLLKKIVHREGPLALLIMRWKLSTINIEQNKNRWKQVKHKVIQGKMKTCNEVNKKVRIIQSMVYSIMYQRQTAWDSWLVGHAESRQKSWLVQLLHRTWLMRLQWS